MRGLSKRFVARAALAALSGVALAGAAPAAKPKPAPKPAAAVAGAAAQIFANPPKLPIKLLSAPTATQGAHKQLDLNIVYTPSRIYNPASGSYDHVYLRSYNGTDVDPNAPFVAPSIEVKPGDKLTIALHNKLPSQLGQFPPDIQKIMNLPGENVPPPQKPRTIWEMEGGCDMTDMPDVPHCFNGTNLHTHGLWVSPSGNSDNVLISIDPGKDFTYEYDIPSDHPAGTFWYHTHRHGSTALQVSSGMAGALVIRGDRTPTPTNHGDIDTLLKKADGTAMTERLLVLQQIQYACLDDQGNVKTKTVAGKVVQWVCDPADTGVIESYAYRNGVGFGPGDWVGSNRHTTINGEVMPIFQAKAGDVERWRVIHGGVRDTISLQFYRLRPNAPPIAKLPPDAEQNYLGTNCDILNPIPYHIVAQDGLTTAEASKTRLATLQPGYRVDALVVFPTVGTYCVVDAQVPAAANVARQSVSPRLLGLVRAGVGTQVKDPNLDQYLTDQLVAAAKRTMPADVVGTVVADLQDGLKLTSFTPHPTVTDEEVKGRPYEYLTFFIDTKAKDKDGNTVTKFEVASNAFDQPFTPAPYDPDRIDRKLVLGTAQEWHMQSRFVSHPFHIHVNPFEVMSIIDPQGNDVSLSDAKDGGDPQYAGLKGVWKDTLWIKGPNPPIPTYPGGIYTITVRTRYERYTGEYVLHCHILDHEDQGMMQNVEVVDPKEPNAGTGNSQPMQMHH